jgi:hypothetical protein
MIEKRILCRDRVRRIGGSFGFIEHRFLRDGFFASLTHDELLLYVFLVVAGDRAGLSYYSYDKICTMLAMDVDDYIAARNGLIGKDLLAFDGRLFQVLSLPEKPAVDAHRLLRTKEDMAERDPATVSRIIKNAFAS